MPTKCLAKTLLHFQGTEVGFWCFPPRVASSSRTSLHCLSQLRLGGCEIVPPFSGFENLRLVSLTSVVVTDLAFKNLLLLPPFPKDLPTFRLRVFSKDLPTFALFLIWQNKFPYLPSHVTII